MDERKRMKVLCPVENERTRKTFWKSCGIAFENRDGSTNIYLDLLPTNGRLQLRDFDSDEPRRSAGDSAPAADSLPF